MGRRVRLAWWDGGDWEQMQEHYGGVYPCIRVALITRRDGRIGVASEWSPPLAAAFAADGEAEAQLHGAVDEMARVLLKLLDPAALKSGPMHDRV